MEKYKEILYDKFRKGLIDEDEIKNGLDILSAEKYKSDRDRPEIYLHLAIAFILSSIVYIIAYNWHVLGSLHKIFIMVFVVFIPFIIYNLSIEEKYRKLALFSMEFLIGIMFALFGQVYQTGADAYMLFVIWSISIMPMVVVVRYLPSYFLFFITASAGAILYTIQSGESMLVISIVNILPLIIMILVNNILKKDKRVVEKIEKFFITLLFLYFLVGASSYAIRDENDFFLSFAYYVIWAFGIFFYKKEKYYKLLSLIPLFTLIPPAMFLLFKDSVNSIESFLVLTIVIIAEYAFLIKGLNVLRGDKNE